MTEITLVGIDLAKNVFQLCATDGSGRIVKERRLRRAGFAVRAVGPAALCGGDGSLPVGRTIGGAGSQPLVMRCGCCIRAGWQRLSARTRTTGWDTRAICEAARQPGTRFVPVKNLRQQELQSLVRLRDGLVKQRTSSITRLRSILHEHGLVLPKGRQAGLRRFRQVAAEAWPAEISELLSEMLFAEAEHIEVLTRRIVLLKRVIEKAVKTDQQGRRLLSIPGIGPLTAAGPAGRGRRCQRLCQRSCPIGLARPGAAPGWHWWAGPPVRDYQTRQQLYPAQPGSWRPRRDPP